MLIMELKYAYQPKQNAEREERSLKTCTVSVETESLYSQSYTLSVVTYPVCTKATMKSTGKEVQSITQADIYWALYNKSCYNNYQLSDNYGSFGKRLQTSIRLIHSCLCT
jgi:hypothetical protein